MEYERERERERPERRFRDFNSSFSLSLYAA
jgi:hypothetical protein